MPEITYQPKGSMCMKCIHVQDNTFCHKLPFKEMKIIEQCNDVRVVKCTEYSTTSLR